MKQEHDGFPDELNVMGRVYKVRYVRKPIKYEGVRNSAQVDFKRRVIRIFAGNIERACTVEDIVENLLHEIFHILVDRDGVIGNFLKQETEEKFIRQLAIILTDTLVRNHFQEWGNKKRVRK